MDARELISRRMKAERRAHLAREIIETVLLTLLVFLVVHFAVQTSEVTGPSMEPGLVLGERMLVNRMSYLLGGPHRGDVIVFHHHHIPVSSENMSACTIEPGSGGHLMTCDYVKRVIAVPGDTVAITPTQVIVDGVVLQEPYAQVPPGEAQNGVVLPPEKLGANQYFVIGDNRLNSSDSRYWGPVSRQDIIGRVVMVFWPLSSLHWLQTYSSVFSKLKP